MQGFGHNRENWRWVFPYKKKDGGQKWRNKFYYFWGFTERVGFRCYRRLWVFFGGSRRGSWQLFKCQIYPSAEGWIGNSAREDCNQKLQYFRRIWNCFPVIRCNLFKWKRGKSTIIFTLCSPSFFGLLLCYNQRKIKRIIQIEQNFFRNASAERLQTEAKWDELVGPEITASVAHKHSRIVLALVLLHFWSVKESKNSQEHFNIRSTRVSQTVRNWKRSSTMLVVR